MIVALPEGKRAGILFPNAQTDSPRVAAGAGIVLSLESGLPAGTRVAALAFAPGFDPMAAIRRAEPLASPLAVATTTAGAGRL